MDELQKLLASIKQAEAELRAKNLDSDATVAALQSELTEMRSAMDALSVKMNRPQIGTAVEVDETERRHVDMILHYARTGEIGEMRSLGFTGDDSSFVLPAGYAKEIATNAAKLNEIRPLASVGKTGSASVKTPIMARPKAAYGNVTPTDQELAVGGETLEVNSLKVLVVLAEDNLADSQYDLYGKVSQLASEAIAEEEAEKFMLGDGIKQPTGIAVACKTLEIKTGFAATLGDTHAAISAIVKSAFYKLSKKYRKNAVLMCNSQTEAVLDAVLDADGTRLLTRVGDVAYFSGIKIVTVEAMDDIGANKTPVVVGDLRYYEIYDRAGISIKRLTGGNFDTSGTVGVLVTARHAAGVVVKEAFRPIICKI
jgi:HK97 family phage major capsid protein